MAYSDVKSLFLARMNRRDLIADTTGLADGFLANSIKRIQRTVDLPAAERTLFVTIDATYFTNNNNIGGLLIPADFLRIKDITYTNLVTLLHQVLKRATRDEVLGAIDYGIPGIVLKYVRQGGFWILGSPPLLGDLIQIDYYAEYSPVINPTDDNILLDIAPDAVVFGALSFACDHYNDKRGPLFEQRFTQILSDLQMLADDDELSGDAAVGQTFYYPPDHL
jgi:hypothetical protein